MTTSPDSFPGFFTSGGVKTDRTYGNRGLSVEEGFKILTNLSEGKPPFEGMGRKGGVTNSWFVLEGNPTLGRDAIKSPIKLQVTINNGTPTLDITKEAEALYNDLTKQKHDKLEIEFQTQNIKRAVLSQAWNRRIAQLGDEKLTLDELKQRYRTGVSYPDPSKRGTPAYVRLQLQIKDAIVSETFSALSKKYANSNKILILDLKDSVLSQDKMGARNGKIAIVPEALKKAVFLSKGPAELVDRLKEIAPKTVITDPAILKQMHDAVRNAPSLKTISPAETAVRTVFRHGGRILMVIALTKDSIALFTAKEKIREGSRIIGGWTGAFAVGGATAVFLAPGDGAGPAYWGLHGVVVLVASAWGYSFGGPAGERIYEYIINP